MAFVIGGTAAVQANLAPAMFSCAFWPPPYVDNEGEPIEPPAFPDPPYVAATFLQPDPPNGENADGVICMEALNCGTWQQ